MLGAACVCCQVPKSDTHRLDLGNLRDLGVQVEYSQVTRSTGIPFVGLAALATVHRGPGSGKQVRDSGQDHAAAIWFVPQKEKESQAQGGCKRHASQYRSIAICLV